jgi:hypothetical protein
MAKLAAEGAARAGVAIGDPKDSAKTASDTIRANELRRQNKNDMFDLLVIKFHPFIVKQAFFSSQVVFREILLH